MRSAERATWKVKVRVDKYAGEADFARGTPYEALEREGNLLLNEGIALMEDLLIGAGGTVFNNANGERGQRA